MATARRNTSSLSLQVGHRRRFTADWPLRKGPNTSVYRHLLHEVTELAVNFSEILMRARIICTFRHLAFQADSPEMNI